MLIVDVIRTFGSRPSATIQSGDNEITLVRVQLWRVFDLWRCAGLVVGEYSKRNYMANTTWSRLLVFIIYWYRRQVVFAAKTRTSVQATISVIPDRGLLPSETVFPEISEFRSKGKIAELGNLARNPDYANGKLAFEPIMTLALIWTVRAGVKTSFLSAIPSHGKFYQSSGFTPIANGEKRRHPKVKVDGVGMVLDMLHVEKSPYTRRNLRKYAFLRNCVNRLEAIGPLAIGF